MPQVCLLGGRREVKSMFLTGCSCSWPSRDTYTERRRMETLAPHAHAWSTLAQRENGDVQALCRRLGYAFERELWLSERVLSHGDNPRLLHLSCNRSATMSPSILLAYLLQHTCAYSRTYRLLLSTTPLFARISGAVVTYRQIFSHFRRMPGQRSAPSGCLRAARERLRGTGGRDGPQSSDARRGDPAGHPGEDPAGRSQEADRRTGFRLICMGSKRVCRCARKERGQEEHAATYEVYFFATFSFRQFVLTFARV